MRRISLIPLEELSEAAPAPASRDSGSEDFARLLALIALVADPVGCGGRVGELQAAVAAAARETAELARLRAEHDAHIRKATAALEAREGEVRARELKAFAREMSAARHEEHVRAREQAVNLRDGRYRVLPGGVVQDFGPDPSGREGVRHG